MFPLNQHLAKFFKNTEFAMAGSLQNFFEKYVFCG